MSERHAEVYAEFSRRVTAVVARGLRQTGQAPLAPGEAAALAETLWALGQEGGWAARFDRGHEEMAPAHVARGVERLRNAMPGRAEAFAGMAKQVLKACFQPAPAECRDSYRECDAAGRCRRQERTYDLARLSGAHCVDCPHWEAMAASAHLDWLAPQWRAGRADLEAEREVFLPEDFRMLRTWRPPTQTGE